MTRRWSACLSASPVRCRGRRCRCGAWPAVLLDWQFAPAWPRIAALACCAALGFVIGIAGVDRHFDGGGSPFAVASRADLGSIVFEPEALTGARP